VLDDDHQIRTIEKLSGRECSAAAARAPR